jgi:hypothetical protein
MQMPRSGCQWRSSVHANSDIHMCCITKGHPAREHPWAVMHIFYKHVAGSSSSSSTESRSRSQYGVRRLCLQQEFLDPLQHGFYNLQGHKWSSDGAKQTVLLPDANADQRTQHAQTYPQPFSRNVLKRFWETFYLQHCSWNSFLKCVWIVPKLFLEPHTVFRKVPHPKCFWNIFGKRYIFIEPLEYCTCTIKCVPHLYYLSVVSTPQSMITQLSLQSCIAN